ncbi:helix-turn-helix transcriptional regulator [Streptomyces sp. NPDC055186]
MARNVRMPVCALRARRSRRSGLREGPTEAGGGLPEAVALRQAAAAPDDQDWFTTRPWLLAQLAGALAESGQHTEAVRTLIEVRVAARRTPRYPLAEDHIALEEARILGRSGDVPGTLRRAEEVARRSAAAGRKATALAALHLLVRLGRAAVAVELLDALGVAVRCPLGELRALHVRAPAGRFARLPLAAECAIQTHRLSRDAGRHRAARISLVACSAHLAATVGTELPGGTVPSSPSAPVRRLELTAREHQTAALAASGLENGEIARRLSVSVRTVENHLCRAYGRLGITSRAELGGHFEARSGLVQPPAG